jgi:hypothetical protein
VTSWRYTGNSDGTAEQTRDLQDRIGRFARTVFSISGVMLVASFIAKAREDRPASAQALRVALLACEDAARYDADAAREWWRQRAQRAERDTPAPEAHAATIEIDLSERKAVWPQGVL